MGKVLKKIGIISSLASRYIGIIIIAFSCLAFFWRDGFAWTTTYNAGGGGGAQNRGFVWGGGGKTFFFSNLRAPPPKTPPPLFYRDRLCRIIISILINTVDLIGSFFQCCKRDRNALCTQKIVFFSELQE